MNRALISETAKKEGIDGDSLPPVNGCGLLGSQKAVQETTVNVACFGVVRNLPPWAISLSITKIFAAYWPRGWFWVKVRLKPTLNFFSE